MFERAERLHGTGWLVLIGGGEFSFGETVEADKAWLAKAAPAGPIGFLPTASGSEDYAGYFSAYAREGLKRDSLTIPIYRGRDARRVKNCDRITGCAAIYLGGGIADQLVDTLAEAPALEALEQTIRSGGVVVAIAAAAQAVGAQMRNLTGKEVLVGFSWLPRTAVETNFDPAHDRRVRDLLNLSGMRWGLGLPAGSALLIGPECRLETVGPVFILDGPEGDWSVLGPEKELR